MGYIAAVTSGFSSLSLYVSMRVLDTRYGGYRYVKWLHRRPIETSLSA